ncbi:LRRIQ4 [Branchiostoma lanceolatum]|uniref:Leucine-rich repeat and death domain-containing protein 1 n=1 Tax=Branchiostoma lanceolatum TaxID=7740 RepID=A0A8K0EHT8_BRALA|nr:LRRIQ4 [Branchiostoma lanceolatum]
METSEKVGDVKGKTVGARKPPRADTQSIRARKTRTVPTGRLPRSSSSATEKTNETPGVQGRARLGRSTERYVGNGSQIDTPSVIGFASRVDDATTPGCHQEKAIVSRSSLSSRYLRRTGVSDARAQLGDPTSVGTVTLNRSMSQPPSYDQAYTGEEAFVRRHSEGVMATASSSLTPSNFSGPLVPYKSGGDPTQSTGQDSFLSKFRQKYAHLLSRPKPSITTKEDVTSRPQRRLVSISFDAFKPIQDPGSRVLPREDFGQRYVGTGSRRDSLDTEVEEYSTFADKDLETEEDIPREQPPPGGYVNALYLETSATPKSTQDPTMSTLFVNVHLTSPTSPGDPTMRVAESLFQGNLKDEQRRQLLRKALAKFRGVLSSVSGDRLGLHFFTVQHLDNFWSKVNLPGTGSVSDRLESVLITDQMRVAVLGRKLAVKVNIDEEEYLYVRRQIRKSTSSIQRTMTLTRNRFAKVRTDKEKDVKPSLTSLLKDEDILKLLRVSKQRDRKIRKLESTPGLRQFGMRRSQSCGQIESEDAPFPHRENRRSGVGGRAATPIARPQSTDGSLLQPGQSLETQQPGLTDKLQKMESVLDQIRRLVGQNIEEETALGRPRVTEAAQAPSLRPDVVRDLEHKTDPRHFPQKRESRIRQGDGYGKPPIGPMRDIGQVNQSPSAVMSTRTDVPDIRGTEIVPIHHAQMSVTPSVIEANRDSRIQLTGQGSSTSFLDKGSHPILERLRSREKSKQAASMKPEDMQIVRRTKEPSDKGQTFVDANSKLRTWKPKLPLQELVEKLSENLEVQSLDLSGQQLKQLPDELQQLVDLVRLDLSNNKFKKFPTTVLKLPKLEHLNISRNTLSTFPVETRLMSNLRNLQMTNMALEKIPSELCDLSNLEVLNIRDNNLTCLPDDIGRLEKLTTLQLSWNKFQTLSESVCELGSLEVLYLDYNQLRDLPRGLGRLARLRELWISSNQIQHLPDEICQLLNIEVLSVNNNKLTALPVNICSLSKLWMMHVRNNAIQRLPEELHRLTNLQVIDVSGNPLEFPPVEVCGKGLSAIMGFVRDHALPGSETGYDGIMTSSAHLPLMSCSVAPSPTESPDFIDI